MKICACIVIICVLFANIFVSCMSCGDGYFLDENRKCEPCPEHCLFCDSSTKCLSCESGYWGNVCEAPCSKCQTGTSCEKTNGFCLEACLDGLSGVVCDASCDSKCFSCKRTNILNCVKCAFGRYPPVSCEHFCSTCNDTTCDDKGNCIFGCVKGYWGKTCKSLCPEHCLDKHCGRKNGDCIDGCERNYAGKKCDDKEPNPSAIIIIVSTTTIVTILGIIVAIFIWRRRQHNSFRSTEIEIQEMTKMLDFDTANATRKKRNLETDVDKVLEESAPTTKEKSHKSKSTTLVCCVKKRNNTGQIDKTEPTNKKSPRSRKPNESTPERENKLYEIAESIRKKKSEDYTTEFKKIPISFSTLSAECMDKINRRPEAEGIGPYEDNKVTVRGKGRSYYFNASFIVEKGRKKPTYIASIGPNSDIRKCFQLFWRMIWQYNCRTIVMLNTVTKKDKEQYWPDLSQRKMHTGSSISILCETEQKEEDYTLRHFIVKQETETRPMTHFQYTAWPEGGGASNINNLLKFCKAVLDETSGTSGPVVVHGRTGIGRTGTFIALVMLREAAEDMLDSADKLDETHVDIKSRVEYLRSQRAGVVETPEQYKFLHEALVQVILHILEERGYQKKDG